MKKIFIFIALVIITSCSDDYLDVFESNSLTPLQAFNDINLVNSSVLGMYDRLQETGYYGRNFLVIGDIASDNAKIDINNSGRFIQEYNFSMIASSGDAGSAFDAMYEVIHGANLIIDNINQCETCSIEDKNRALGHAYGLRALGHFDLVRLFAYPYNLSDSDTALGANGSGGHLGVPIITSSDSEEFPSRNTVEEVYNQIISDLETAGDMLTGSSSEGEKFFSYMASRALLARVYLYKEDYENALFYSNQVIESGIYSLIPNDGYVDSWKYEGSSESIFEVAFNSTDYPGTNSLGYIYIGYRDILPSKELYSTFEDEDVRLDLFANFSGGNHLSLKFLGRDGVVGLSNTPVLRLSEIYLIKAESLAKMGSMDIEARETLDEVRFRANPSASPTVSSGDALIDDILLERRKELAFEGHRLFDLLRNNKGVHRIIDDIVGTAPEDVPYLDHKLIFPIPQAEMNVNANMIQNLGY